MDKMKRLFLVSTTVFVLLLSVATENILAWPCNPPACPTCETCTPTGCECQAECGCGGKTCSGCCVCSNCSCVPDDSKCGDPDCWDCDNNCDCQCDITVNSVSSNKDFACVGCDVTFTADLLSGGCSCIDWSGGGDPATASDTCTFVTKWDSPGVKTVTATPDCGSSKQKQVTIVEVVSVSANKDTVNLGCDDDVTFTVTTDPPGHYDPITWSAPGGTPSSQSGGQTFTTHWDTPGTKTVTASCGSSSASEQVDVIGVSSLAWEKYDDNLEISGNKIYPGKKTAGDALPAKRRKVWIKATVIPTSKAAGQTVYFSWWDVDDPCSDPIIDDNGNAGDDNRGSGESLSANSATADASGVAKVVFTVSMQPGDNFMITASTCQARLNELTQAKVDSGDWPRSVKSSPVLTTWRKLHLERDSMVDVATSGPEDNWVRGGIDTGSLDYDPVADETKVALHQDLADCWEEGKQYHFAESVGEFYALSSYDPVRTISHVGDDEIVVDGNCSIGWPCSYELKDDDDMTLLPELPSMAKLNKVFKACYITCDDNASGGSQTVAFQRNVGGADTSDDDLEDVAEWGSIAEEADNWWVVYVLSAYQPGWDHDWDPDMDPAYPGMAHSVNHQISAVYREVCGEHSNPDAEAQVVAHEIGHQVLESGAHTNNTIMQAPGLVDPEYEKFSPADIATIRGKVSSPGI